MAQGTGSINSDYKDWEWSDDAGERARLLQSPSVETVPKNSENQGNSLGTTSALGAVFIVVNAALGAGLLNFPAAFSMAGGVAAGITLQMVRVGKGQSPVPPWEGAWEGHVVLQKGPGEDQTARKKLSWVMGTRDAQCTQGWLPGVAEGTLPCCWLSVPSLSLSHPSAC